MAGACPPERAAAIARAGSMGALGALLSEPSEIASWVRRFRALGGTSLQINLWVPDPELPRDHDAEARVARFLEHWGPPVGADVGAARPPDFAAQCDAVLAASPTVVSSIMGLFPAPFVERLKARGLAWFATATTAAEARAAEAAGADAIVAQGMEAGGHRGAFEADEAERQMVGLMALAPQVVDAVSVPVIATGGIADARGVAAALVLGASAVQIGTGFLRCPEAGIARAYAEQLARTEAHETMVTRAFSGRLGRGVANAYARAASGAGAPRPAAYPVQRGLARGMREEALKKGDTERMQMWAGQSAKLAQERPAGDVCTELWEGAVALIS